MVLHKMVSDIFLGIPDAEPPVHDNRFKHSTLKTQWSEPIDATEIQPIPTATRQQIRRFFSLQSTTFTEHEDCLYLNIWKQHNDQNEETCHHLFLWW